VSVCAGIVRLVAPSLPNSDGQSDAMAPSPTAEAQRLTEPCARRQPRTIRGYSFQIIRAAIERQLGGVWLPLNNPAGDKIAG